MEKSSEGAFKLLKEMSDPLKGKEGTIFDAPPPSGPPQSPTRGVPNHLLKVAKFLSGVVADESLLLDLCVDRATEIVEFNFKKRAFGADLMQEISPLHFIGAAAPLAVELYKECVQAVIARKDEYAKVVMEAQEDLKSAQKPSSQILVP